MSGMNCKLQRLVGLPVNNSGRPPLTWEGANGPCEESHGRQCQCTRCLLASANADIDPVHTKGQVCRGAYIVSGVYYIDKHGKWTHGINGPDNWWETVWDATQALKRFREANAESETLT